jgi:HAD superfamily hydrolase (TIGR01549 family)
MTAVTFDYGQTLAELDTDFLAKRVGERGGTVTRARLDAASNAAWAEYDRAKREGKAGSGAWQAFMTSLLTLAGTTTTTEPLAAIVQFLWDEQPRRNLWRRPIAGMKELTRELAARGVPLAIISNSEGRLAELVAEVGFAEEFPVVADSGLLGVEKPDRRIFEWTAERLGTTPDQFVHIGDVWAADVEGAIALGARAIWITPPDGDAGGRVLPESVVACHGAAEIRATLVAWKIL